ncbi:hypothetical protein [Leptospira gomenensis]|uniref:hypothetical protein n=1 Tax=Leptospira gomenensis TaxID=2484974 RepID=UPI00143833D1|nr:hypothetical protein [Leptospira gomenensis]
MKIRKVVYTIFLFLSGVSAVFSEENFCSTSLSQHTTLRNAVQYYKSEKYQEAEIELSRLTFETDCSEVRIFQAFAILRQGKDLNKFFRESDFADVRFRILYSFSGLIRNRNEIRKPISEAGCLRTDCRLEELEEVIGYLSSLHDFDTLEETEFEAGIKSDKFKNSNLEKLHSFWKRETSLASDKEKNPYLAALFSVLIPGTGQIYANQFAEGVTSGFVNFVLISASYAVYLVNPTSLVFYALSGSTLLIYSSNVVGGYSAANRNNNYWKSKVLEKIKKEWIGLRILEEEILYKLFPAETFL